MFTRKLPGVSPVALVSRSRGSAPPHTPTARISASRSVPPTSRRGTPASCRTAPACPPGSGTAAQGAPIYAQQVRRVPRRKRQGRHQLGAARRRPITSINAAEKTIANFWPYATTLFDYIRRAMPWQQPKSLTSDEVYALTAYMLALNKVIGENDAMNATTLPKVRMPNRDGFIIRFQPTKNPRPARLKATRRNRSRSWCRFPREAPPIRSRAS